ncbi:MAG: Npun_F0494 family protein [Phormidesmis sp.]
MESSQIDRSSDADRAIADKTLRYSLETIHRAQRAVRCSPFYFKLLAQMRLDSVSVPAIAEDSGALKGYTQQPLSEVAAESELMWLAEVGLLRREVDGQGLTDSFRLTPLGRQIVERWQSQGCPDERASLMDYMKNAIARRFRLPEWLM